MIPFELTALTYLLVDSCFISLVVFLNYTKKQPCGAVDNLIGILKTCVEFILYRFFKWGFLYDGS